MSERRKTWEGRRTERPKVGKRRKSAGRSVRASDSAKTASGKMSEGRTARKRPRGRFPKVGRRKGWVARLKISQNLKENRVPLAGQKSDKSNKSDREYIFNTNYHAPSYARLSTYKKKATSEELSINEKLHGQLHDNYMLKEKRFERFGRFLADRRLRKKDFI